MKFAIVADYDIESNLNEVLRALSRLKFEEYFANKNYGGSNFKIGTILMCRDPRLKFKQRIRFSKKENILYMDIMLDFERLKSGDSETRKKIVAEKLVNEVPQIVAKYKFKDFDLERFSSDLSDWFKQQHWISI